MGVALSQMDRLPEAQRALECSLSIEPASIAAWTRIAPVFARQGQTERAARIESRLSSPNSLPARALLPAVSAPCTIGAHSLVTP
jgi:predicted Zn-dependent protease